MRVVHVLCDLSGGGAERLVLDLCRRSSPGVQCEVITVQAGGTLHGAFAEAGIPVRCAGRRPGALGTRALRRMVQWMKGADVVHTHLWAGDVWGRTAAKLAGVPVLVSTEHNLDRDEAAWKHQLKVRTARWLDRLIAVSDSVAEYWCSEGVEDSKIVVIPNGVDRSRFEAEWVGGGGLLYVGRLAPQKGIDVLVRAMVELPDVHLDVAGDGPLGEELRASAPANVRFLGEVSDVPERLARADALVVPSRWEGFGLAALEGLAAGVPVITTGVDGLTEVVADAAVTVPEGDMAALVQSIRSLLADDERRRALSSAGRARSTAFSLARTVDTIEGLYSTVHSV